MANMIDFDSLWKKKKNAWLTDFLSIFLRSVLLQREKQF